MRTRTLALAPLFLLAHCRSNARPAEPPVDRADGTLPTLHAVHVARGVIHVDGRLDEPAWQTTGSTGPFVDPGSGHPSTGSHVNATARIAWDDDGVYVGAVVYDASPATPFARTAVDPHLWEQSSALELMLQPGDPGDNTQYFEVQVDTAGAVWDTRFDDYNQPIAMAPDGRHFGHQEWESHLRDAAVVDASAGRYTLEFMLPWSTLTTTRTPSPPHAGDTWRANLYSFRDGQRDSLAWSPLLGQGNFHRASRFGRIAFQ